MPKPAKKRKSKSAPWAGRNRAQSAEYTRPLPPEKPAGVDPTTCDRLYSEAELELLKAMDRYKRENRRPHPTWSECLRVLISLGYRKVAAPTDLPKGRNQNQEGNGGG